MNEEERRLFCLARIGAAYHVAKQQNAALMDLGEFRGMATIKHWSDDFGSLHWSRWLMFGGALQLAGGLIAALALRFG